MRVIVQGELNAELRGQLSPHLVPNHWLEVDAVGDIDFDFNPSLLIMRVGKHAEIETLTALKHLKNEPQAEGLITFALLSENCSPEIIDAFSAEEADLINVEPLPPEVLGTQIRAALKLSRNQLTINQLNTELFQTSITDTLTQVLNRNGFMLRYEVQWRLSLRNNSSLALLTIGLDHFKRFNDLYGHVSTDSCLVRIAQDLQETLVSIPHFIGRQGGGEEFTVLLPEADARDAMSVADELRHTVQEMRIENRLSPTGGFVTASIGVSVCLPSDTSMARLLRSSEKALKKAKRNGRNQVCFEATPNNAANVVYLDHAFSTAGPAP